VTWLGDKKSIQLAMLIFQRFCFGGLVSAWSNFAKEKIVISYASKLKVVLPLVIVVV